MKQILCVIALLVVAAEALAYQPCTSGAAFCLKLVNKSPVPAKVISSSTYGFKMPDVIVQPHSSTGYIPVMMGGFGKLKAVPPWQLVMKPLEYSLNMTSCTMLYNKPVSFAPIACGEALSHRNPYKLTVKFDLYALPE